jgi:protoporphyrinogen oxidase
LNPRGQRHIGIIGAGLSGLSAAYDLARQGHRVTVVERGDALGGLASSLDIDGFSVERFYHFICRGDDDLGELASELGVSNTIDWNEGATAFFYEGRFYPFRTPIDLLRFTPIPASQRLRFGATVLRSRLRKDWDALDGVSARQWLSDHMGRDAYRVIWDPLLRVKFGPYHNQISAAWMWHRINRVARSRVSYFKPEVFGCFRGGSNVIVQALVDRLGQFERVTLRTGSAVARIEVGDRGPRAIHLADGAAIPVDAVVSTMALAGLTRLVPELPLAYREQIDSIRYLGVVCGLLVLKKGITDSFWLNINDARTPFNGLIEYSNLNRWLRDRLGGRAIVYIPQYIRTSDPMYSAPDDELLALYKQALRLINPAFRDDWIERCVIGREAWAQAICTVGFKDIVPGHRTPVPHLYITDSVQYYPEDRTISAAIRLGRQVAKAFVDDQKGSP